MLGRPAEVRLPVTQFPVSDVRLGQVVDHHAQFGKLTRQRRHVMQMLDIEQQIEGQIVPLQNLQSCDHVRPDDEVIIGFVLCDVSHADELRMILEFHELLLAVG